MDLDYCTDCNQPTGVSLDHATGDSICLDCGLVLEARYIDTTAEWRTFTDSDDKCVDPSRVGAASNPMLDAVCDPAATIISAKNRNSNSSDVFPRRSLATANAADKSLHCAFQLLDQMSDGLGLVRTISDHAKVLFKTAHDHRKPKGKNLYAVVGACLYLACKEKGVPRGIKEIEKVANGSSHKAINKAKNDLVKLMQLGGESNMVIKPADIARRCCSRLWMDNNDMKMSVLETLRNLEEQQIDIRRQPNSVLAAVMYLIVQLYNVKANLSDLSQAAGCEVMTTKRAYKDLYPYASRIVPNKFKFGDLLLNKLCAP